MPLTKRAVSVFQSYFVPLLVVSLGAIIGSAELLKAYTRQPSATRFRWSLIWKTPYMISLDQIEFEVKTRASIIGAADRDLPTFGYSMDAGWPHIEADSHGLHYAVVERGKVRERNTTDSLDELLYFVFSSLTFNMAQKYELAHRVKGQDVRRIIWVKQIELLSRLAPQWAERESKEIERILTEHPFYDRTE